MNYHEYTDDCDFQTYEHVNGFRRILSKYSLSRPFWITEANTKLHKRPAGGQAVVHTLEQQSQDVVKRAVVAFDAGVEVFFWHCLDDNGPGVGLYDKNERPKPAYYNLKLLIDKIGNFDSVQRIDLSSKDLYLYKFTAGGKATFVLWTESGDSTLDLSKHLGNDQVKLTWTITEVGRQTPRTELAVGERIPVTKTPVFVEARGIGVSREASPQTEMARKSLRIADIERAYYLYVPRCVSSEKPSPLVLAFHGRGRDGNGPAFARKSQFNPLAEKEGFIVAYPEGIDTKWLDGGNMEDSKYARDVEFVEAIINEVSRLHKVDPDRVYATGFSNGAAFSHILAIRLSHRLAAIAAVGATLERPFAEELASAQPVSVMQFTGSNDPFCGTAQLQFDFLLSSEKSCETWVNHNGCRDKRVETNVKDLIPNLQNEATLTEWKGGKAGAEVTWLWIRGATHGWPIPTGKGETLDPTPLVWKFFKAHSKAATR